MRARARRFRLFLISGVLLVSAVALTLFALSSQLQFYYDPADIAALEDSHIGQRARVGGLVKVGSVERFPEGGIAFTIEDSEAEIHISYDGFIPDLFREGQGVICNGRFSDTYKFEASELLARHDENYVPRELQDQLKADGVYRGS